MSTGLVRKFSAPSCMARTAVATSVCPVRRMTEASRWRRCSRTSMPSMPGKRQIQDDHFGPQPVERGQARLAAQLPGDLVAEALEVVPDAAQNVDIVIDQEDRAGH